MPCTSRLASIKMLHVGPGILLVLVLSKVRICVSHFVHFGIYPLPYTWYARRIDSRRVAAKYHQHHGPQHGHQYDSSVTKVETNHSVVLQVSESGRCFCLLPLYPLLSRHIPCTSNYRPDPRESEGRGRITHTRYVPGT